MKLRYSRYRNGTNSSRVMNSNAATGTARVASWFDTPRPLRARRRADKIRGSRWRGGPCGYQAGVSWRCACSTGPAALMFLINSSVSTSWTESMLGRRCLSFRCIAPCGSPRRSTWLSQNAFCLLARGVVHEGPGQVLLPPLTTAMTGPLETAPSVGRPT